MTPIPMQQAIDILKAMKRKAEIKRWTGCGYMIDTIDEAIHKIEALGDGWIPVTKKLPTYQGFYLVKIKGRGVEVRYAMVYFKECGIEFQNEDVTHWQPLPNPPTK